MYYVYLSFIYIFQKNKRIYLFIIWISLEREENYTRCTYRVLDDKFKIRIYLKRACWS